MLRKEHVFRIAGIGQYEFEQATAAGFRAYSVRQGAPRAHPRFTASDAAALRLLHTLHKGCGVPLGVACAVAVALAESENPGAHGGLAVKWNQLVSSWSWLPEPVAPDALDGAEAVVAIAQLWNRAAGEVIDRVAEIPELRDALRPLTDAGYAVSVTT